MSLKGVLQQAIEHLVARTARVDRSGQEQFALLRSNGSRPADNAARAVLTATPAVHGPDSAVSRGSSPTSPTQRWVSFPYTILSCVPAFRRR